MKMKAIAVMTVCAAAALVWACSTANSHVDAQGKVYEVGGRGPAGGWIFYDKGSVSDGWRFLEAAPEDASPSAVWCNGEYSQTGVTGKEIGAGLGNTLKIVRSQGDGVYAAMLCVQYRFGGADDWFLPSEDEAKLLYKNLGRQGIGGFADEAYWCSTEDEYDGNSRAAIHYATRLAVGTGNKRQPARVRAVRRF